MSKRFNNGYALLIGVDENAVPSWSLPEVKKDIDAFRSVLTHPERCAYPDDHVTSLTGNEATRDNILDGLASLREEVAADKSGNATAVIYYSGHGWRDAAQDPPDYYLIPCNVSEHQLRSRALRALDFAAEINDLESQRLLVIMDCCHAGGMGVKGVSPEGYLSAAVPPRLFMGEEKAIAVTGGSKGIQDLATGTGRAVISSSQAHQSSYTRRDGKMGIFTYHLIEALTGHAKPDEAATQVLVTDLMSHVYRHVPVSARADWNVEQVPDYLLSGNFPVALLLGGQGLSKGAKAPDPSDPLEESGIARRSQVVHGPQTIIGGNVGGNVLSGDFDGPVSVCGGDAVDMRGSRGGTYFNQKGQRVGKQTNIGTMSGGFYQPDMTVRGNVHQAGRDIVMGDRLQAGRDINQSLQAFFDDLLKRVEYIPKEERSEVRPAIEKVRDQVIEIQQGGIEDETSPKYTALKKSLKTLVDWVPDIADVVLGFLQNPATGIISGVRKVAERLKARMDGY